MGNERKGVGLSSHRLVPWLVCCLGCFWWAAGQAAPGGLTAGVKRIYVNTAYLAKDYGTSTGDKRFSAQGEGEFLLTYYKVQFNLDLQVSSNRDDPEFSDTTNNANEILVEQAYFDAPLLRRVSLLGGVLHNPLGYEQEDAPDRDQVSHGQIWNLINGQTRLPGNSVQGLALRGAFGHSSLFAGFFNDLGGIHNRHSVEVLFTTRPMDGLDVEGGFLTQASLKDNPSSAETLFDVNARWRVRGAAVAVEYFAGDKLIDSAYGGYGRYRWRNFMVAARGDWVRYLIPNVQDTNTLTLTAAYLFNHNFRLAVEYRINRNPNTLPVVLTLPADGSSVRLQALMAI